MFTSDTGRLGRRPILPARGECHVSIGTETQTKTAAAEPGSIFVTGRPLFVAGGGGVLADEPPSTDEDITNGGSGKKDVDIGNALTEVRRQGAKSKVEPKMH